MPRLKWIGIAASVGITCLVCAYFVYGWDRFRSVDYAVPFDYWGDVLITLPSIKAVVSEDWVPFTNIHSERAGAPFGMNWGDWPQTENVNFMGFRILGWFTPEPARILNLYYALSFIAIGFAMTLVLLRWRVRVIWAAAAGLVFAFLPFHYLRYHHTLLANYYAVPFVLHYALRIGRKRTLFFRARRIVWQEVGVFTALAFLIGGGGVYYAFFACFFLLIAGVAAAMSRKNFRPLAAGILASGTIGFFATLNLLPHFIYRLQNGTNPQVGHRAAGDAEFYALRLMNMVTPLKDHRWNFMEALSTSFPKPLIAFEGVGEYIGVLAILGSFIALGALFARRRSGALPELGFLWMAAFALGAYGGFGELFNSVVFAGIRCYNRLSPFIAGIGLMSLFFLLDRFVRRFPRNRLMNVLLPIFAVAMVGLAFGDQVGTTMNSSRTWERYLSDRDFVRKIESDFPNVHMILQLPYIPFPEAGNIEEMPDFAHFVGYTNSQRLRWSYGVMRERPGASTIQSLSQQPIDLAAIRAGQYDGIYIDRAGFHDGGESILREMSAAVKGPPTFSRDQRLVFYPLTDQK